MQSIKHIRLGIAFGATLILSARHLTASLNLSLKIKAHDLPSSADKYISMYSQASDTSISLAFSLLPSAAIIIYFFRLLLMKYMTTNSIRNNTQEERCKNNLEI